MALYNMTRFTDGLLRTHEASPPSFVVRLYREYWTLNNGSKFLYNNQTASLLDDIRTQHIPVDLLGLFDAAKLPFYEGCLIVELLDYRPAKSADPELENPERTRVVLTPNDESLWADICLISQKNAAPWTDADALETEARLLLATAPPLCLEPDIHLTRIVNATQRVSTPPAPNTLKRKAAAVDQEADEIEKARRLKLMQFMSPQRNVPPGRFPILDALQRIKQAKAAAQAAPVQPNALTTASPLPGAIPTVPAVNDPTAVLAASAVVPAAVQQPAPPAPSTPVPSTHFHNSPTASSPAPVPLNAASPPLPVQNLKKPLAKKKSDAAPSPRIARASVTPAPTAHGASGAPLPIPPHLQQHYAQLAQRTATPAPVQSAPSPLSASHASSPPAAQEQQPSSAVPINTPAPPQPVQQIQAVPQRPVPSPTPAQQQPQQQQPNGIPAAYAAMMTQQQQQQVLAAAARRKAAAAATAAGQQPTGNTNPQAAIAAAAQNNGAQMAYYMYQAAQVQAQAAQAQAQAQRLAQAQQAAATPAASRSPMPTAQAQATAAAQRNSPMVSAQQIAARSPMPPARPLQQTPQPQVQAPPQPPQTQHPPQHQINPYMMQYANMRLQQQQQQQQQQHQQQQHQQQQHQQQVSQAAAAQMLQNPQLMAQYHMYNHYARMGQLPPGQLAPGQLPAYWQVGAGRGMPIAGGQAMTGMAGHPQQTQPGALSKPAQGGQ